MCYERFRVSHIGVSDFTHRRRGKQLLNSLKFVPVTQLQEIRFKLIQCYCLKPDGDMLLPCVNVCSTVLQTLIPKCQDAWEITCRNLKVYYYVLKSWPINPTRTR
jgi:hypothetical protein